MLDPRCYDLLGSSDTPALKMHPATSFSPTEPAATHFREQPVQVPRLRTSPEYRAFGNKICAIMGKVSQTQRLTFLTIFISKALSANNVPRDPDLPKTFAYVLDEKGFLIKCIILQSN